jgi:hypothetical protein
LSAGLGAGDGKSMMDESIAQTVCRREAAFERRAGACVPKGGTKRWQGRKRLNAEEADPTRDAGGRRGTTGVAGEDRTPDPRMPAGQKKAEPPTATRRRKPPRAKGKRTANSKRGGRNGECDEEMRFPVLISARQRIAEDVD